MATTSIVMRSRVCNYWNWETTLPVRALTLLNCASPELSSTQRWEREKGCENNRENLQLESKALAGGVVALGKFDALHVGDRDLAERAAELGVPFLVSFAGKAQVLGWEVRSFSKYCGEVVPREHMLDFVEVSSFSPEQFVAKLAFELKVKGVVAVIIESGFSTSVLWSKGVVKICPSATGGVTCLDEKVEWMRERKSVITVVREKRAFGEKKQSA